MTFFLHIKFRVFVITELINNRIMKGDDMSFGEKLKKLRIDRHLSLETVSKALGIGKSTLSEYENDITRPSLDNFFCIVEFYHINENYFYGNDHIFLDLTTLSKEMRERIYTILAHDEIYKK